MLEIIDLKFGYGAQELFNKASVTIYNGEHVGLIGLNGVGKSTLMNLLAFRLTPDEGKIIWDKNVTFSYLGTLPYHLYYYKSATSVLCLAPVHFRRSVTRLVSYYALFKGWLLLSQPPSCSCDSTSFPT